MSDAAAAAARATGNPGINNTAWLFFILAAAFLFYVTIKGDLPKWLGLFGLAPGKAAPAAGSSSTAGPAAGFPNMLGGRIGGNLQPPALPALPNITGAIDSGSWDVPQPAGGTNAPQDATW